MKCLICNTEMYCSSFGFYECRNFNCPPGTADKYKESWKLRDEFLPKLEAMSAGLFTISELSLILSKPSSKESGFLLRDIYIRLSGK